VGHAVLTVNIAELRKTLGDDPQAPRFIETVHRRGYRFLPTVSPNPLV
jgi:DNA-binding winged helix-turn-helix (wHTH) protein